MAYKQVHSSSEGLVRRHFQTRCLEPVTTPFRDLDQELALVIHRGRRPEFIERRWTIAFVIGQVGVKTALT